LAADRPLFTGSVEHSLDDKGRLVVPSRFRERLGAGFYLTIGHPDPCLALYPASTWRELSLKLENAEVKDADFRKFVRFLLRNTEELSCDAQGRLMIPAGHRSYADIDKDVVSIGTLTRVEIWSRDVYERENGDAGTLRDFTTELGLF
jgi:MraZ protein